MSRQLNHSNTTGRAKAENETVRAEESRCARFEDFVLSIRKESRKDEDHQVKPEDTADDTADDTVDDAVEKRQQLIECAPGFEKLIPPVRHTKRENSLGKE